MAKVLCAVWYASSHSSGAGLYFIAFHLFHHSFSQPALRAICNVSLFLFYFIHYFCTLKSWCCRIFFFLSSFCCLDACFSFSSKNNNPVEKFSANTHTRVSREEKIKEENKTWIALTIYHKEWKSFTFSHNWFVPWTISWMLLVLMLWLMTMSRVFTARSTATLHHLHCM